MRFLFGYGSLIATPNATPRIVRGLQRGWFGHLDAPGPNPTYLGVQRAGDDVTCNGVVFPVSEEEFARIVEDEPGYDATLLSADENLWYFASRERLIPDPDFPILQSYVDVCLDACLQIGRSFAEEFLQSTSDWSTHWSFDRVEHPNAAAIDALLLAAPNTREIYAEVMRRQERRDSRRAASRE